MRCGTCGQKGFVHGVNMWYHVPVHQQDPCKGKKKDDLCDLPGSNRKKNGACKRGKHSNGEDDSVLFCVCVGG